MPSSIFSFSPRSSPRQKPVTLPDDTPPTVKSSSSSSTVTPNPSKVNLNSPPLAPAPSLPAIPIADSLLLSVVMTPPKTPAPPEPEPIPAEVLSGEHPAENWWPQRSSRPWTAVDVDAVTESPLATSTAADSEPSAIKSITATTRAFSIGAPIAPLTTTTTTASVKVRIPRRRPRSVPEEQAAAYIRTAIAVSKATGKEVLKDVATVAHDALDIGVDFLNLAPIPALGPAVKLLLSIWDAVDRVETSRMACLSLAERCANVLVCVIQEIHEVGDEQVAVTLREPMNRLIASFTMVNRLMKKQADRPFIKRYLKRDEVMTDIQACHDSLTDSMSIFNLSIQFRLLSIVQAQASLLNSGTPRPVSQALPQIPIPRPSQIPSATLPSPSSSLSTTPPKQQPQPPQKQSASQIRPSDLLATMESFHRTQTALNTELDENDLKEMIRSALTSDARLLDVLQVEKHELPEAIKTFQRALEESRVDNEEDLLHHEFLEEGVGAMRRLSGERVETVPFWTITRWEIDREQLIGLGFFSEVYRGTWKSNAVAIKVLAPLTPRDLFRHEVEIWKTLKHPNVLELLGASSTTGNPPFFAVSPYCKNGNLVSYLSYLNRRGESPYYLQYIHEIATGMEYLHEKEVLHGDLKACNVLINDDLHCVISDFGQSEMKTEVYRLSGRVAPRGTLRWLAPEVMQGGGLTPEVDIYAFAICCVEVLNGGELPWPLLDDFMVRHLVVEKNERPKIPWRASLLSLAALITSCWDINPAARPPFSRLAKDTAQLLGGLASLSETASPGLATKPLPEEHKVPSPLLRPSEMPPGPIQSRWNIEVPTPTVSGPASTSSYKTVFEEMPPDVPTQEFITPEIDEDEPVDEHHHADSPTSTISSSDPTSSPRGTFASSRRSTVGHDHHMPVDHDIVAERRTERIYRLRLQHEHHASLKLPLWHPSEVHVGAVGYLQKPQGKFVTLFNAFEPEESSDLQAMHLPPLAAPPVDSYAQNKRNAALRGLDWAAAHASLLFHTHSDGSFRRNISRRYEFALHPGHKSAHIIFESSVYHYMRTVDAAKRWFSAEIDAILKIYGPEHGIHKEDVVLIIGKLDTPAYGLFVNHSHPDSILHFNVFSERQEGADWGAWSVDEPPNLSNSFPGPNYDEPDTTAKCPKLSASKVSKWSETEKMYTILLARLHFKTDALEPTSL